MHELCEHGTSAPCEQCAAIAAQQAAEVDALRPIIARLKQRVADEKDKIIAERDTEIVRLKRNWEALRGQIEQDYRELRERVGDPRVARDSVELSVLQAMSRLEQGKETRHV